MKTRIGPAMVSLAVLVLAGLYVIKVEIFARFRKGEVRRVEGMDLSGFSAEKPKKRLNFLFIHHSCGGQLLADKGEEKGEDWIYESHPNGGGLRRMLEANGYTVHEASYNSDIGDRTDIFDWPEKFGKKMDKILRCKLQDELMPEGKRNDIVAFKSCFPNNDFKGIGSPPGNPNGPELTLWNAKAAYTKLLEEFEKYPGVLFVCVTAPPLSPYAGKVSALKYIIKSILGGGDPAEEIKRRANIAREFNNWLKGKDGWLKGYRLKNVVVFDYYDVLTEHGESNLSCYATEGGKDSHPSSEGNRKAAEEFVPFLNRAVRRAGLSD